MFLRWSQITALFVASDRNNNQDAEKGRQKPPKALRDQRRTTFDEVAMLD